jgi:hypothetical protein
MFSLIHYIEQNVFYKIQNCLKMADSKRKTGRIVLYSEKTGEFQVFQNSLGILY